MTIPTSDFYETTIDGAVATVWLNRPEKLNAMNRAAWADLPPIFAALSDLDEVRVVMIAARGGAFTAGLDLIDMAPLLAGSAGGPGTVSGRRELRALIKELQATFTAVASCPKPVIAAIHGPCIGAGVDLITACDIRVASSDSVFSIRETKLAMVADVGTLQRLPRIVSPSRIAELVYTGRDFDAEEAAAIGLVSRVLTDAESALDAAYAVAGGIAANSPLAVQGAKAVLAANEGRSVDEALDYVSLWNAAFLNSEDLAEAMQAYAEGREPDFRGK